MSRWPMVALGDVLSRANEPAVPLPGRIYDEVTIRLWGKGLVSRGKVDGASVTSPRRIVRAGQLLLSKIDARNGALGIVPPELEGALVSNDFPSYTASTSRLLPSYLGWLVKTPMFLRFCQASSEGTTNRIRLREDGLLANVVPLPPITEQQAIVTRLDALAEKSERLTAHWQAVADDIAAFTLSLNRQLANGAETRLGDLIELCEVTEVVKPGAEYPQVGLLGFGGGLFSKAAVAGTETTYKAFNRLFTDAIVLSQLKGWEGALALCPPSLAGRFVSPEYRTFRCIPDRASPGYLSALMTTPWFWGLLQKATRGVGARRERIKPGQFLDIALPIPSLDAQKHAELAISRLSLLTASRAFQRDQLEQLRKALLNQAFS